MHPSDTLYCGGGQTPCFAGEWLYGPDGPTLYTAVVAGESRKRQTFTYDAEGRLVLDIQDEHSTEGPPWHVRRTRRFTYACGPRPPTP